VFPAVSILARLLNAGSWSCCLGLCLGLLFIAVVVCAMNLKLTFRDWSLRVVNLLINVLINLWLQLADNFAELLLVPEINQVVSILRCASNPALATVEVAFHLDGHKGNWAEVRGGSV